MIAQDFKQTGLDLRLNNTQPRVFQVFGERSSGTNFVKRLLGRNSPLRPVESMGWKHGFPHMTAIPQDLLVVCVVRDARPWALSMHAKPWHCPPAMQSLEFSDFIRAEWATIADRKRYFPQVQDHGGEGQVLQHDRHPITGAPFENLFALRQAKLQALLSFFQRGCSVALVRMEDATGSPQSFLDRFHTQLGQPALQMFKPIHRRLGSKFLSSVPQRPETPKALTSDDLAFLRQELDLQLEAELGYDYD